MDKVEHIPNYAQKASARLNFVINPFEKSVELAQQELERRDWESFIDSFPDLKKAKLISPEDFSDVRLLHNEINDLSKHEEIYSTLLWNVGLILPDKLWSKLKGIVHDLDATAVFCNPLRFKGAFRSTGVSFFPNFTFENNELWEETALHESMHSSFLKYSFFLRPFIELEDNSRTLEDFLHYSRKTCGLTLISELNSYSTEINFYEEKYLNLPHILKVDYIPDYVVEESENLWNFCKKYPQYQERFKSETQIKEVVESNLEEISCQLYRINPTIKSLQKNHSPGLLCHIFYNCSDLSDILEFDETPEIKRRVMTSLGVYANNDEIYKKVYEEAMDNWASKQKVK